MKLLLSHTSALQYWRAIGRFPDREAALRHLAKKPVWSTASPSPHRAVDLLMNKGFTFLAEPIHLLTSNVNRRIQSASVSSHVETSPLPSGSIVSAAAGIGVCSPELCFVQMATSLTLPKLIELGFELCGAYGLLDGARGGFVARPPLTSTAELAKYLSSVKGMRGSHLAQKAMPYIVDGSASPMETVVTMLLCLPLRLGGYGFALPSLNHRIDMGNLSRTANAKDFYRCDLHWADQNVSVEYDSRKYHSGNEKQAYDASRANALKVKGTTVISITPYQVFRDDLFNDTAALLAKCLGRRLKKTRVDWTPKRMELRRELLDPLRSAP